MNRREFLKKCSRAGLFLGAGGALVPSLLSRLEAAEAALDARDRARAAQLFLRVDVFCYQQHFAWVVFTQNKKCAFVAFRIA